AGDRRARGRLRVLRHAHGVRRDGRAGAHRGPPARAVGGAAEGPSARAGRRRTDRTRPRRRPGPGTGVSAPRPSIAVLGSANMDLVAYVAVAPRRGETVTGRSFRTVPGGKGANQAVAAARAG